MWVELDERRQRIRPVSRQAIGLLLSLCLFIPLALVLAYRPAYAWPIGLRVAWSSPESDPTYSVAWGDWDSDGDLDLAAGNYNQPNRVYANVGGRLALAWSSPEAGATTSVAWGDWDGDGKLDLAVGNFNQPNRVYENVGGDLALAWSSPETDATTSVAWGDWDGDMDLDLAVGNRGQPNRVYENLGGDLALAWSSPRIDYTTSVAWGDCDGDGDPDLAVGNYRQPNRLYENAGGDLAIAWSSPETGATTSVSWGDWDGDEDLDLAVGNYDQPNWVYENGGGLALAWSSPETDYTYSVAWGDWDGDGDLDLAVGNRGPNRVYDNMGGSLALRWSSAEIDYTTSVAWGDWDGDLDLDLAAGNRGPSRVYANVGGSLALTWSSPEIDATYSVAWGDWDGDGDLDLALGNYSQPDRVYENVGGSLALAWSSPEIDATTSVAWGDWDGDGDLDLAVGNRGQPNQVYANVGGSLAPAWSSPETDATTSVAWGDWNGDGNLDLAVGNYSQPNRVYEKVGGSLALAWSSPKTDATYSVAWADWDGDRDLDLAVGNRGPSRVYENRGGSLALAWSSAEIDYTTSVAWGDWDGDGDLDLAMGNRGQPNRVYENVGGDLALAWSSPLTFGTFSVAWGDWNNDGDPDLAVGNYSQPNRVYENVGGGLALAWSSPETGATYSVAWGDLGGDGDLDLAVGNLEQPIRVYENVGGNLALAWTSPENDRTRSLAWGDWDGDRDLDLAVGNLEQPNRVYENVGGDLALAWSSPENDRTTSVAWGDWDGDGDLDLVVGNDSFGDDPEPNRVYENVGGTLALAWSAPEAHHTTSVAWGDWDGDGDLDLAVGNYGQPNQVYENVEGSLALAWSSPEIDATTSVAWGDWDGDGDLDLAAGNDAEPNRVYENEGGGLALAWSSAEINATTGVAWGDWDGDGDFDLAVGNYGQPDRVYANAGSSLALAWSSPDNDGTTSVAWGDWDGDGDLDLAAGTDHYSRVYFNPSRDTTTLVDAVTRAHISQPGGAAAPFFSSATVLEGPALPITYTLFDPEGDSARLVRAHYSLDGGSIWQPAVAATGTPTTNLEASPTGTLHAYTWDIYGSHVFGATDSAVLRLDVYQGFTGPGPYQVPFRRAQTLPFRVRGSQVRVVGNTAPVAGAMVYRQPAGQTGPYTPYDDDLGRPFRTNPAGYLQGWGELAIGDQLVALLPITYTDSFSLYYTSAAPTPAGLDAYTVTALGVQTLTVSADNPLVLFNPSISLEWDARNDEEFLAQLEHDLRRTSELLYDWTNGQAALGQVTVYHDRLRWNDAYVRVYASNQVRPSAVKGGIVSTVITDPLTITLTYEPGQVRMGPAWNRYGDPGGDLGEDWPLTLAHELAHFALFQDDDYLGLDDGGKLIPVDSCTGTAMADPYRDDYSELHPDEGWLPDCEQTLSHRSTGRSDWATVTAFYPWLQADPANSGPSVLPLAVTGVGFMEAITPPMTVEVPIFSLFQDGARVVPGAGARAFLFQTDLLLELGLPALDQVLARGARPGDRLCLFEPPEERLGCETVSELDRKLDLSAVPGWQPEVLVTPVTSRTLGVTVANVPSGLSLHARVFPANYPAPPGIALAEAGGQYSGTFLLDEPAFEGYVQVWVDEAEPRREAMTGYSLGGNPGHKWSRFAPRGSPGHKWSRFAPVMSSDGQLMLYGEDLEFEEGEFLSLQALAALPSPPAWVTVVGQAYRLAATANAPDLANASIAFGYLGSDVPPGEELWLKVYFWDGAEWHPLHTDVDLYHNIASAPAQGLGAYALMSSVEIPLYGPGWNLIAYPVQGTRPITEALTSIDGFYTTVYGWDASDPDPYDRWRVYDVTVPPWVNTLHELEFGQGYWITVTQDITLYLRGGSGLQMAPQVALHSPPATYFGPILPGSDFTPTAGMEVNARIGDQVCGQTETIDVYGQVVYAIKVLAEEAGDWAGCGAPGRAVAFWAGSQALAPTAVWSTSRVWEPALWPLAQERVYLPLIVRQR